MASVGSPDLDPPEEGTKFLQSVDRAVRLLKHLSEHNGESTVTDIATKLGVHKSTASRLVVSLESHGLVRRNKLTERCELGPESVVLGGAFLTNSEILRIADPQLRWLASSTEDSVNLMVRYRDDVLNLEQIPGRNVAKPIDWLGKRMPLHRGSGARVLLAHLDPRDIEDYLSRLVLQDPSIDIVSLGLELQRIRETGHDINRGAIDPKVYAIGAPILDHRGRAQASISIAGYVPKFTDKRLRELLPLLSESVQTISRQLGYERGMLPYAG